MKPLLSSMPANAFVNTDFTGTGLSYDSNGLILVNIQRYAPGLPSGYGRGHGILPVKSLIDNNTFYLPCGFPSYICVLGSDASPRFCPTTYNTTVMIEATTTDSRTESPSGSQHGTPSPHRSVFPETCQKVPYRYKPGTIPQQEM